ncbi:SMC-Scp complex subunit ScpB [Oricola sp.]|uniref:SMC-Scp complex subunit ScpB n=1 Tax=Oricola sp. TaxID=1979950 RepID=UPI003BAB66D2
MTDTIEDTGEARAAGAESEPFFEETPVETDNIVALESENPARRLVEAEALRMAEALVFASAEPVTEKSLADRLPDGVDIRALMTELQEFYEKRGVNLLRVDNAWVFRTAGDLGFLMQREEVQQRKLSRAALEVLAIIAYHQPVTRAEMEDIRGVETSKGTIDVLLETGWIKMRGRRKTPGRPVTYGTTVDFLDHFGLSEIRDLPGMEELKGAGLLSARMPTNFEMPLPAVEPDELTEEEEAFTDIDLEELGLLTPKGGDD